MGSCYSSTYKSNASTSVEVNLKGCDSAVTTVTQEQRSSGRWKRKKGWGSDGNGFGGEIEIPGRMCSNGSSEVACLYTQQGKKGTNQDAMLVWENFNSRSDTTFCGVFDGHGPFGHMVAKKVRDSLPIILCTQWKANYNNDPNNLCTNQNANGSTNCEESSSPSIDDEWCESLENEENGKIPEMYQPLKVSMLKAFKLMDKELKLHPTIDCFCSGSTAVTLIKQGEDLIIGNVGDSRAVLATRDTDNSLVSVQLTVDLKPDLPGEAARIQQCKGRVFALQDEPEVARVWLPTSDSPGLAMARAFGDFCLKDFGLISIPDVYHHRIKEKDEFVILATDGVWDVLSNTEAVDIVASAPSRTTAARALVDCATRSWRLKYPTSKNDDCAVVCLFLDHQFDAAMDVKGNDSTTVHVEAMEMIEIINENSDVTEVVGSHAVLENSGTVRSQEVVGSHAVLEESGTIFSSEVVESHAVHEDSGTLRSSDEIVPVFDSTEEKIPMKSQSRRTLAECISNAEEEEWSALEGVTRVNSLLSLPRFLSGDKRTASWRKWL